MEQQHIRPYVPLPDFDQRTDFFGQQEFRYDAKLDVYFCPAGKELHVLPSGCTDQFIQYRGKPSVCNACPLKAQCTSNNHGRKLSRHIAEDAFERVRAFHQTDAYTKAMNKRKVLVEPLFAEAKDWHGMRRFRLRERWRVNCEALVTATGQNLKRLLKKRGWGRHPWPMEAICRAPKPSLENEELHMETVAVRRRTLLTVASIPSLGLTKKRAHTATLLFASFVTISQMSSTNVCLSCSFVGFSLRFSGSPKNLIAEHWTLMTEWRES